MALLVLEILMVFALCIWLRINGKTKEYMVASRVLRDGLGFKRISDVKPGQAVFISAKGDISIYETIRPKKHTPCIFEHVYFSRPDSIIDDISVYKSRLRMGEKLADKILN